MVKKGGTRRTILLYLVLVIISFLILMPAVWTFITSIKTQKDVISSPVSYIPRPVTWENYKSILISFKPGVLRTTAGSAGGVIHVDFARCFFNSVIVGVASSVLGVVIACLAAYGLSRYDFKGKTLVGFILILTQLIPGIVYIFPIYLTYIKLNMLNKNIGLIIVYMSFILPFSIWMLRGYFNSVPRELEEAAMIDGCSSLGIAFKIIFPLSKPAIIAIWILAVVTAWKDFLYALILNKKNPTLAIGIYKLIDPSGAHISWPGLSAMVIMVMLPVILLFLFTQKYYVKGMTAGGIKM